MFIIKNRNLALAVLICFTLAGCGLAAKTVKPENIQAQQIKTWLSEIRHKVKENINRQGIEAGHHLKLLVVVNDSGYSESISIVESTGNRKLEIESMTAIIKSEPFHFPNVDENYRPRLKKIVFYVSQK